MATVTGPLLSVQAYGQFGKTIIYERLGGATYAKEYKVPANNRFPSQVGIRAMVYFLTKLWHDLPAVTKATWSPLARSAEYSTFNAFFTLNMKRWAVDLPPLIADAEISAAAYDPVLAITATGGDGQVELAITKDLDLAYRIVAAVGAAPVLDCRGNYFADGTWTEQPTYKRRTAPTYYIYLAQIGGAWNIEINRPHIGGWPYWYRGTPINGNYGPANGSTGTVSVGAELHDIYTAPAAAVAIFRGLVAPVALVRNNCRAVLSLDVNGAVTFIDTDQVGGKAGPIGGLAAATYYYRVLPLSLDGRAGTSTSSSGATVT